jgi:hypothetical protein
LGEARPARDPLGVLLLPQQAGNGEFSGETSGGDEPYDRQLVGLLLRVSVCLFNKLDVPILLINFLSSEFDSVGNQLTTCEHS